MADSAAFAVLPTAVNVSSKNVTAVSGSNEEAAIYADRIPNIRVVTVYATSPERFFSVKPKGKGKWTCEVKEYTPD